MRGSRTCFPPFSSNMGSVRPGTGWFSGVCLAEEGRTVVTGSVIVIILLLPLASVLGVAA